MQNDPLFPVFLQELLHYRNLQGRMTMGKIIDLRSDTVTQPTDEMRQAMFTAQVGDDVYGDDPTMNRLEALAAQILGKEAALFTPSGTMGNEVAVMTHTQRGDEVILGAESHIVAHEVGSAAVLSGVMLRTLHPADGILRPEAIEKAIRDENDIHMPHTALVCVEEPLAIGSVVPLEALRANYQMAHKHGLPVHMDGARLFNAALALGVEPREIAQYADSVMVCLSKGLCAPVGSVLAGTKEFIRRARKNRKLVGGGMRQAGFLAAAGIVALEKMTKRLGEDHENAAYLASLLEKIPGIQVDRSRMGINMVFFTLDYPEDLVKALPARMLEQGIKINGVEDGFMRFVTSNDVDRSDVERAAAALETILREG